MKLLLFLAIFSFQTAVFAQPNIQFKHNGEWQKAVEEATANHKIIFMDAFTTWCGPCKMMAAQVFTSPEVAAFFNENFVNVKMDMEHDEGLDLARKYDVRAYPTLLFIDPTSGEIVHRAAGFQPSDVFISTGKTALDPSKRLSSMQKRYESGDREPSFLYDFAMAKAASFDGSHGPIAAEYLKTQTDWATDKNLDFIFQMADNADSEAFKFLTKNKDKFIAKFGRENVLGRIEGIVSASLEGRPDLTLDQADAVFKNAYPENWQEPASRFHMTFFRQKGDREGYAKAAVEHYKKFPSKDAEELNEAAWTFFKVVENPDLLKTAVKWAKKSAKLSPSFYNYDTLANLYFKLKSKKPALKAAKKAIELARAAGEDFSQTQELLDKIQTL